MRKVATERRFENQIALVTGGGKGIGKSIALRLAEEGAAVAVTGRSPTLPKNCRPFEKFMKD